MTRSVLVSFDPLSLPPRVPPLEHLDAVLGAGVGRAEGKARGTPCTEGPNWPPVVRMCFPFMGIQQGKAL